MKDSQKRTCCDISLIHQDEFHDFCRNGNPSSFIRNRKMPLANLPVLSTALPPPCWIKYPMRAIRRNILISIIKKELNMTPGKYRSSLWQAAPEIAICLGPGGEEFLIQQPAHLLLCVPSRPDLLHRRTALLKGTCRDAKQT